MIFEEYPSTMVSVRELSASVIKTSIGFFNAFAIQIKFEWSHFESIFKSFQTKELKVCPLCKLNEVNGWTAAS